MDGLIDLWSLKYERKNQWRDIVVNNYINSIGDDEIKQLLCSSLSGTVPVSLYGKSQVGKTTFLLKLMDIKDECLDSIHDILRCGSRPGTAATPTAMIYKRTPGECFKIHYSTYTRGFNNEEDIRRELTELRRKVENQEYEQTEEITIEIPERYFNNNFEINIQVCDLPGIDSSNERERPHVERILKKFIPISALILVFQIANDINDVSNLFNNEIMSEVYGWKYMSDRYRLITTRSYSAESVVAQINSGSLNITKEDIKCFYRTQANYDNKNKNNVPVNVNIYPFEFGESFREILPLKYDINVMDSIMLLIDELWAEIREEIRNISETGNVVKRISAIPHLIENLLRIKKEKQLKELEEKDFDIQEKERKKRILEKNNEVKEHKIKEQESKIQSYSDIELLKGDYKYSGELKKSELLDSIDLAICEFQKQLQDIYLNFQFDQKYNWLNKVKSLFFDVKEEIKKIVLEEPFIGYFGPTDSHKERLNKVFNELNNEIETHYNPEITREIKKNISICRHQIKKLSGEIESNNRQSKGFKVEIDQISEEKDKINNDFLIESRLYEEELKRHSVIYDSMLQAVLAENESVIRDLGNKSSVESFLDLMYLGLIIKECRKQLIYK